MVSNLDGSNNVKHGSALAEIRLSQDGVWANRNYTGSGQGLFAWGAHLEKGVSVLTDYIPTANTISGAPRFDHDPVTGESLGLLIEEARTNLLLNSETLSTQTATVTATAHTLSFYGTGTVTLSGAITAGPLVGTGINDRVKLTFTPTAGSLTVTVSGSVTKAQLEEGAFPTSYIPTTSSTVTRAADVASIGGADFSSFYNQSEGTIFTDHRIQGTESSNGRVWKLTTANRLFYRSTMFLKRIQLLNTYHSLELLELLHSLECCRH